MTGVVVDASAVIAIIRGEADARDLALVLDSADERLMSAATHVEASMVIESSEGAAGGAVYGRLLESSEIQIRPVDAWSADCAVAAWRRFGKGQHRAALNFGDCFVYALAESTGFPILCTGNDFVQTDLEVLPAR